MALELVNKFSSLSSIKIINKFGNSNINHLSVGSVGCTVKTVTDTSVTCTVQDNSAEAHSTVKVNVAGISVLLPETFVFSEVKHKLFDFSNFELWPVYYPLQLFQRAYNITLGKGDSKNVNSVAWTQTGEFADFTPKSGSEGGGNITIMQNECEYSG